MEENVNGFIDFLSEELFSFVNDETHLPSTSSHINHTNSSNNPTEDIIADSLLLQAIENFEALNEQESSTTPTR